MNKGYFMGYKVNTNIKYYRPNTVLFTKDNTNITVTMAQDAVDYILEVLACMNLLIDRYKKQKMFFQQ